MEGRLIGERGQVVIPEQIREQLQLTKGVVVIFRVKDSEVIMQKAEDVWKKLERVPRGPSLMSEILQEKKEKTKRERMKWNIS